MASFQNSSASIRVWNVLGATALLVSGAVLATYVVNKIRRDLKAQQLLGDLPLEITTESPGVEKHGVDVEELEPQEPLSNEEHIAETLFLPIESPEDHVQNSLETMTVGQLYQLAKENDIPGRSNMRKAQLIEALKTVNEPEAEG